MPAAPIDATELPEATTYLNYPRQGPPVGSYLGPDTGGEYLTVVSNEPGKEHLRGTGRRVGLVRGCYTIDGRPTDPDGLPPEVYVAKIRADWQALKTPRHIVAPRNEKPVNPPPDPESYITVTHADTD